MKQVLRIQTLSTDAFQPYGWALGRSFPDAKDRLHFTNPVTDFWHEHRFDAGTDGETEILWVNYRSTEPSVISLEKHLLTQQAIVPLTGDVIHVVAASMENGSPDMATLAAFHIPQGKGVCMQPGCWHATRVFDAEVACMMLTRTSTTRDLIGLLVDGRPAQESVLAPIVRHELIMARP